MTREDKTAADLLRKYDRMKIELRILEERVQAEAQAYGKRRGHLFFWIDNLRRDLQAQKQGEMA